MNIYEKNIDCIKSHRNYLYKEYNKTSNPNNYKLDNIQSIEAKNGDKIVLIKYQSTDYRLNSLYNPVEEANRWVQQYKIQNINTVISMFGFGNGVFARALIDKMGEKDCLLIYEPCYEIFEHVLNNYDLTDIIKNKKVVIGVNGINDFEFHNALQGAISVTNIKSQIQCIYPNYDKIFTESCVRFFKELKDSLTTALVNINSTIMFGEKYIDNTLKNLVYLKDSTSIIEIKKNLPEGLPAIVVAAGPSVEENIEQLKKAKGRAVIFAVDRIFDYLLSSGVEPDFVVTLDPMKEVKHFTNREDVTTPLICYFESNYEILKLHKGKKIFCTSNSFIEEIYSDTNKMTPNLLPSGSVAIVAYTACVKLGFHNVILVGQDLAYNDGVSHAGGIVDNRGENANVYLEGVDGNQIKSRYDWKEFVIRYQDLIELNPQVKVIDAKAKGAKIKGTINMPLNEALDKYCNNTLEKQGLLYPQEELFTQDDLIIIKKLFEKNINIIRKIKDKSEKAISECNILIKEYNNAHKKQRVDEAVKRLSKINNFIKSQKIYAFMDSYITAKTAQYLSEILIFTDDKSENSISTFTKSKAIYQAVSEVSDFIKDRLEVAITKL